MTALLTHLPFSFSQPHIHTARTHTFTHQPAPSVTHKSGWRGPWSLSVPPIVMDMPCYQRVDGGFPVSAAICTTSLKPAVACEWVPCPPRASRKPLHQLDGWNAAPRIFFAHIALGVQPWLIRRRGPVIWMSHCPAWPQCCCCCRS